MFNLYVDSRFALHCVQPYMGEYIQIDLFLPYSEYFGLFNPPLPSSFSTGLGTWIQVLFV